MLESSCHSPPKEQTTMKKGKKDPDNKEGLTELHGLRSILSVLSQDHDDLRKMIEILKEDSEDYSTKKKVYADFSELLKSHASSEEKAVYEIALKMKDLKVGTFEAYEEHAVATTLMQKIAKTTNKDQWMARAKVLAEMVEHHIIEEESEYLLDLKEKLKPRQELEMVNGFITRRERNKHQPSDKYNGILAKVDELPGRSASH